ncbi:MAG: hypothetical protein QOE70_2018 [Chthoniobacter sp.]|jgi:hypothetical protein|nr:hypothetical protein [Chthoniobacter sp.]
MKNFSRRLKKTSPLILLGLLIDHSPVNQSAQALVGGPFDDNHYPGVTADGTYSGTISGHNLTGLVTFGVSASQETNGRFTVFHEGFVHYGAATGIADLASRRVAGSLLGVATLGGSGTAGGGVNITDTVGGSGTNAANTGSLTVRSGVEGSFVAKMKGYPQAITFEGKGRLSTNANTAVVVKPKISPITGVINAFAVFFPTSSSPDLQNDSPDEDTNIDATGGNQTVDVQAQRAILRTETPFKIRGSRTSRTVYTTINNYAPVTSTTATSTPFPISTPFPVPPGTIPVPTPVPGP